jgi:hypothetical protein
VLIDINSGCVTVADLNHHGIFSIKPTDIFLLIMIINNHLYRIEASAISQASTNTSAEIKQRG